ncbi:MAG: copper amine oxidase N-terminal protein [Clostridia bacterium]|jgi:hypothetical protein|nr:copper amine oxidase N-terminal protein [Clostridia bacterium]
MVNFRYTKIKIGVREVIMKKTKVYKKLCLVLGLGIALSGVFVQGASITKTLKAVYSNIAISYNGQIKKLSAEPFTVKGTTYIPLRAIGEIIGADVRWANNTIYIDNQNTSSTYTNEQISAINYENALLKQQLEIANKNLAALAGTGTDGMNLTIDAVDNTLSKLKSTYKDKYDVDWEYDLEIAAGGLSLTVAYDSRYDEADFDNMNGEQRKQFIKGIVADIAAVHKEVEIKGILKNSSNDVERAAFRYTKSGSYEYNETTSFSFGDFEKELGKKYKVINCIGFSIPISYIELEERDGKLTFVLITELMPSGTTDDYRDSWNSLTGENKKDLEDFIKEIKGDIVHQYSSYNEIVGAIRDDSTGNTLATYSKSDKLYLNSVNTN